MPRAAVHTLGCRLNQAEGALLADAFRTGGYEIVGDSEPADLYVINSCSVTRGAEGKCRRLVRYLLKRTPGAHVVITGCYAQLDAEALAAIDGVDRVIGTEDKHRLPEMIADLSKRSVPEVVLRAMSREPFTLPATGLFRETRANLKIQDGCDQFCSFCVIPFTRGRERSRELADCLREAEALAARDHKEIVVTGVNIGTYRSGDSDFAALLRGLAATAGGPRIRIASVEPMTIADNVVETMAAEPNLCNYLHLCLQSGDDKILEAMRRPYTAGDYEALFHKLIAAMPDIGLGTDVIVGFPGEDDASFLRTYALIESLPFYHFHVFTFSEHSRTRAARLGDKVHTETAKARNDKVRRLGVLKKKAFHDAQVGRSLEVLFERRCDDGAWTGRAGNYCLVATSDGRDLANRMALVQIESADADRATGSVMEILA